MTAERGKTSWALKALGAALATAAACFGILALVEPPDGPLLRCGKCQAVRLTVPIVYGLPGYELMERAERGEVVLGGCVVTASAPLRACGTCREPITGWLSLPAEWGL